ncbi:indole-3-glycerol phosphate synthase TrpC [Clostridium formicaceticum]|uniref:Indole-3-glycerol phosphate synthase n=1 Tax=Clostridium formicaceticum TaxID=1497 RepID=A0AAC9RJ97_9CLOT|nr:indole-3-glycerol phosphate synthase TrpC [Clostridium formicaceticum]AOY75809.1 indole-3-glycerol phosphate synthase [Clostridium formicaceticum]ARE86138.1 Indole-3-glycerol phosphate synthase [Clostridium formicaceticum]
MILDKIVDYKKKRVEEEKQQLPLGKLMEELSCIHPPRNFKKLLSKENQLAIIAEIKKASPSKGVIRENFDPVEIAVCYEESKVEAVSVLTEDKFFQGNNAYLKQVRSITSCPLLRKDFIIEDYQIYQSKLLGADAILLIAAILTKQQLVDFQKIAQEVGLYCLLEVHNAEELEKVLEAEGEIIGINNRNLKTFKTTLKTTEKLMTSIPKDKVIVSESGIHTRQDMKFLQALGVNAVLIGEGFMVADDIGKKIREFRG